jgi:hypothetical protein
VLREAELWVPHLPKAAIFTAFRGCGSSPEQNRPHCEVACSPHSYTRIHLNCELLWKQQKHTCWYHGGVQPAGGPSTSASWRLASALLQKLHQGLKEYQRQGELSIEFQNGDDHICDRESSNPFRSVRHPPTQRHAQVASSGGTLQLISPAE